MDGLSVGSRPSSGSAGPDVPVDGAPSLGRGAAAVPSVGHGVSVDADDGVGRDVSVHVDGLGNAVPRSAPTGVGFFVGVPHQVVSGGDGSDDAVWVGDGPDEDVHDGDGQDVWDDDGAGGSAVRSEPASSVGVGVNGVGVLRSGVGSDVAPDVRSVVGSQDGLTVGSAGGIRSVPTLPGDVVPALTEGASGGAVFSGVRVIRGGVVVSDGVGVGNVSRVPGPGVGGAADVWGEDGGADHGEAGGMEPGVVDSTVVEGAGTGSGCG